MKKYLLRKVILSVMIGLSLSVFTSCGGVGLPGTPDPASADSNPEAVTKRIYATDGGAITSNDGNLTLTIPAGALDEDTDISISPIYVDGKMIGYEFKPDGLIFNQPAIADFKKDLSNEDGIVDENGDPLDTKTRAASAMIYLQNEDGTLDVAPNTSVSTEEGSSIVSIRAEIPHFTSMFTTVGNGYYVYMTSLGTHYVGSDFKADVDIRYLGYSHTSSYKNMSIEYNLRSMTVTKIKFDVTGKAIEIVSPKELTRNDFLSKRGDTASTRPKFNCNEVGESTVTVTVTVSALVEVTFQPENRKRLFTINQSESTSRKGKCIARISLNDYYNNGGEGVEVAALVGDPVGDAFLSTDGLLEPADGLDVPASVDMSEVGFAVLDGNTLVASLVVGDDILLAQPNLLSSCYHFIILNQGAGEVGANPFENAHIELAYESGAGLEPASTVYEYDEEGTALAQQDLGLETLIDGNSVNFLIPLDSIGLTEEDIASGSLRAVSMTQQATEDGAYEFVDVLDLI